MRAKVDATGIKHLVERGCADMIVDHILKLEEQVKQLESLKTELKVGVTSEGEKPDQSDKDFKITIGFNSLEEFERDVASARQLIPEIIALANMSKGGRR